jgi:hypothetical protein
LKLESHLRLLVETGVLALAGTFVIIYVRSTPARA